MPSIVVADSFFFSVVAAASEGWSPEANEIFLDLGFLGVLSMMQIRFFFVLWN